MTRWILILMTLLAAMAGASPAFAHAALISSAPADSAVLQTAPAKITLTFNEEVAIIRLQLLDAAGARHDLPDAHLEGTAVVATFPPGLPEGTDALIWRVVSTDSHPIGGTLVFSVGKVTSAGTSTSATAAPGLYPALWATKFILYLGLFLGIGGAFFAAWIAPRAMPPSARRITLSALVLGLVAAPISAGLVGLDILGAGLGDIGAGAPWAAGISSTYGATAIVVEIGMAVAFLSMLSRLAAVAPVMSAGAMVALGLGLSLSGHASDAPPRSLTWAAVFLHTVGAAFWAGSLIPLGLLLWQRDTKARPALLRFSRAIPFAVAPLVIAGVLLVIVQFTAVSDLWTTNYGLVLSAKLVAVAALFALAAANRFGHTDRVLSGGDKAGTRALTRSIGIETGLVIVILALVALWRFTPPPRSIDAAAAAAPPAVAQVTSTDPGAIANVTVTPGRAGSVRVSVEVTDLALKPIEPKVVEVSFANPGAGIEAITRRATLGNDGRWRIDGLTLPLAGTWTVTVDALISDFVLANLEGTITIR